MLLASMRPFTAVCSPFTAICSSALGIFKSTCDLLWKFYGFMSKLSTFLVNVVWLDINYLSSYSFDFVLLATSLSTSSGFGAQSKMLEIT